MTSYYSKQQLQRTPGQGALYGEMKVCHFFARAIQNFAAFSSPAGDTVKFITKHVGALSHHLEVDHSGGAAVGQNEMKEKPRFMRQAALCGDLFIMQHSLSHPDYIESHHVLAPNDIRC